MKDLYTYKELEDLSNTFLEENKHLDHLLIEGQGSVLVSSPHSVYQTRKGKYKDGEKGALKTAIYLKHLTNCHFISKTKNNNDDANFDKESTYKNAIKKLIKENKIKYVLDFHSLSKKRRCEVNLGTNFKKNIKNNKPLFKSLKKALKKQCFRVKIDIPFNGGKKTIAGSLKAEFKKLWTIQIEINTSITCNEENFDKFLNLINILSNFIKSINKKEQG